jgi:ornithine cyclodeaminase/alanine dehydrogenase-like protein (mu-crystallin family)
MTQRLPRLKIVPVKSPAEAVRGADLVVTAGPLAKTPVNPVIELDWLKPGCLALPVDFDSYFTASAFLGSDKFYSDDVGQIRYYQSQGYFQNLPLAVGDLGDLAAGKIKGRERDEDRIIACNLGLALDDVVTGQMLLSLAKKKNLGTWLEL